jgi:hypothetical protein
MSQWNQIKRLQPIDAYFKANESQRRAFMNALRSSTGRKMEMARLLQEHIDKYGENSSQIQAYLSTALAANDARAMCVSLRNSMFSHDLHAENTPNTQTEVEPLQPKPPKQFTVNQEVRATKNAAGASDVPTQLAQLNTTVGEINTSLKEGDLAGTQKKEEERRQEEAIRRQLNLPDNDGPTQSLAEDPQNPFFHKTDRPADLIANPPDPTTDQPDKIEQYRQARNDQFGEKYWTDKYKYDKPGKAGGLRSLFKEPKEEDLEDHFHPENKIASKVEFDLFSYVPEGFGNGVDNALYRMDVNRKRKIEWMEPMYEHRTWTGPENGQKPLPYQWKDDMSPQQQLEAIRQLAKPLYLTAAARKLPYWTNLPNEGYLDASSKGLPTPPVSLFTKQIQTRQPTYNPVLPAGQYLRNPHLKNYDPMVLPRAPAQPSTNTLPPVYGYATTRDMNWMQ